MLKEWEVTLASGNVRGGKTRGGQARRPPGIIVGVVRRAGERGWEDGWVDF